MNSLTIRSLVCSAAAILLPSLAPAVEPPPGGAYPIENTALGQDALFSLSGSSRGGNTALGFDALYRGTLDYQETAVGDGALYSSNSTEDVAVGWHALYANTTGGGNVGVGWQALAANTTGLSNVAVGDQCLLLNTTGHDNVAVGDSALVFNTTGYFNAAIGSEALNTNNGNDNTALGVKALALNNSGRDNTAVGYGALNWNDAGNDNVVVGSFAASTYGINGSNNIILGFGAGNAITTGSNNIEIGNQGFAGESGMIRIGAEGGQIAAYIAGMRDPLLHGTAVAVGITPDGQLGVRASSARFNEAIKPMDKTSEAILSLRPVSFRYKKELDDSGAPQFGLVAEDVAKVDPDLVVRDEKGQPFSVRYDEVNAMLLNEFLKEHGKVETLETRLSAQDKINAELRDALKAQAAQIEKVSAQMQASSRAPQL